MVSSRSLSFPPTCLISPDSSCRDNQPWQRAWGVCVRSVQLGRAGSWAVSRFRHWDCPQGRQHFQGEVEHGGGGAGGAAGVQGEQAQLWERGEHRSPSGPHTSFMQTGDSGHQLFSFSFP